MGFLIGGYFGGVLVLVFCFAAGCIEGNMKWTWRAILQAILIIFCWPVALPLWLIHGADLRGKI